VEVNSSSQSGRFSPLAAGNSHCALLTVAWMGYKGDLKMAVGEKFLHLERMGLVTYQVRCLSSEHNFN